MKNTIWLVGTGLILGVAISQVIDGGVSAQAQSSAGSKTCDYTFIADAGAPNIGRDGEVKYDEPWKAVVDGGWTLKTEAGGGGAYIFEKCR